MALNHFSHDHPLMRVNRVRKDEGDQDVVCYGCQKPISSSAYSCNDCNYFLHQKCAKLPKEITHHKHLQHPLTLLSYPPYRSSSCQCDVCGIREWKWFTYHCSECEFDVHIQCVLEDRVVKHESHPHPLTVVHKKALFNCDGCFAEDQDKSYFCNTCEFWIHKSCATSKTMIRDNVEASGRSQIKMALNHFSHDHPLMLVSQVQKEEGEEDVVCYGCQKPISSSAYSCNLCNYFLHKKCAELPKEITHHKHLQHPLTLLSYPPYRSSSCQCDVCGFREWKWFTYHCSKCKFDVHIQCVFEEHVVKHESHPHPLTVVHKKALFNCDACFAEDEDMSYFCNTCEFWIHRSCGLLPSTIQHNSHDHPLNLNYFLPYIHRSLKFNCAICKEKVHLNYWVYGCDQCRYFVHVKCATSKTMIRDNFEASGRSQIKMALNHFSHDHPLMLVSQVQKEEGEEDVVCFGCQGPISTSAYSCNFCNYFLHKKCAELPKEITHHKHLKHPLTLLSYPPYRSSSCQCDVCGIREWKWFTYHCSECEFDVHIQCVLEDLVVKHESHPHPLTVVHKKALFNCDACFAEDKDTSYFCNTCEFWIHKSCALLPSTIQHNSHNHPLNLNYFLPYIHRSIKFNCAICKEKVYPNYWVYGCDQCRYFVHVKCATSKTMIRGATSETTVEDDEIEPSVIKFPIVDKSVNLLDELLKEANLGDTDRATMLAHFSHDHPLILFNNEDELKNEEIIICKGCLLPIVSTPFYGCDMCSFFLHGGCAKVPRELRHPCHQEDHQFNLKMSFTSHDKFPCYSCNIFHNGFRYKCGSCDFTLGVVCALLPVKIRHEAHDHPLKIQRVEKVTVCNGCKFRVRAGLIYRCHTCDYYVDIHCLKLRYKVKHAWDRHQLTLRYPPYSDHPDELYCELCEEAIHPKFWLYHCRQCDQPFHTKCLFPNILCCAYGINIGDTIEVGFHMHKLTPVFRRARFKCKKCDRIIRNADMFLECKPCRLQLCLFCAWSNS